MELSTFIRLCKAYSKMGWSMQAQLEDALAGDLDECNTNALREIERFLSDAGAEGIEGAEDAAEMISDFMAGEE